MWLVSSETFLSHGSMTEQLTLKELKTQIQCYNKDGEHSWTYACHGYSDGGLHLAADTARVQSAFIHTLHTGLAHQWCAKQELYR